MICCEHLVLGYPNSGFRVVVPSLLIEPGEKVALIGPSGSGKTSLLDVIAGVRIPIQGSVVVNGTEIPALGESERRRFRLKNIGFVFQSFELFDYLTIRENILLPASAFPRRDRVAFESRLPKLISYLELEDKLDRKVAYVSRGEQQRVALGRALLHRPSLILADEPTGNLDPGNKVKAIELLTEAVSNDAATLLVATHDESLLPLFDRVVDLNEVGQPS